MPETETLTQIQQEGLISSIPGAPTGQKPKKMDPVISRDVVTRQLTGIEITPKMRVKITFVRLIPNNNPDVDENQDHSEEDMIDNEYSIKSKHRPHIDLINALKKLRKHALEVVEMDIDSKTLPDYTVSAIKIHGDMLLKKSRVVLTISKLVKRTGKVIKWGTPQVRMHGESDYQQADDMTKLIEEAIEEAWRYLDGKFESSNQLPLF